MWLKFEPDEWSINAISDIIWIGCAVRWVAVQPSGRGMQLYTSVFTGKQDIYYMSWRNESVVEAAVEVEDYGRRRWVLIVSGMHCVNVELMPEIYHPQATNN